LEDLVRRILEIPSKFFLKFRVEKTLKFNGHLRQESQRSPGLRGLFDDQPDHRFFPAGNHDLFATFHSGD